MGPQSANSFGNVHGGVIMKLVDEAGAVAAVKHARSPVVTAAVDNLAFLQPIPTNRYVMFHAELVNVGRTSIDVYIEVIAENAVTGEQVLSARAHMVYVAVDEHGQACPVPPLILQTDSQRARAQMAQERRRFLRQQREQT